MSTKELTALTDEELVAEAKKMKSNLIMNALFIGFLIGIVVFSIIKSRFGFLMLIPLFFAYKLLNKPVDDKELKKLLKERNLT